MTLQQALEFSRTLAKHNPFARMKDGFDRSQRLTPEEQGLANQDSAMLKKSTGTEELVDLMNNQKWKTLV